MNMGFAGLGGNQQKNADLLERCGVCSPLNPSVLLNFVRQNNRLTVYFF